MTMSLKINTAKASAGDIIVWLLKSGFHVNDEGAEVIRLFVEHHNRKEYNRWWA